MSPSRPPLRRRRLNLRTLTVLGALILVTIPALIAVRAVGGRGGRKRLLTEAEQQLAKKEPGLALAYLSRYLAMNPDDDKALALKAGILADAARNEAQVLEAAQTYGQLLGRLPEGPAAQDARRRLARLNLRLPGRARAAEAQARELIRRGADDAEAHRLLAESLERMGVGDKKPEFMEEARREFEKAGASEPGDVEAAERLAVLYRVRLEDPAKARQVLDSVVAFTAEATKTHAAALLARARYFVAVRDWAKAEADVAQAVRDDPDGLDVRLAAAELAVQRRDPASARRHLDAIEPSHRNDLRVKVNEGLIDLVEQRPDDAIANWRAGLVQSGGGDADLTWRLAHILLETGKAAEAGPLISQYRRLVGGETPDARYRYINGLALLKNNQPVRALAEFEAVRYKVDKSLEPHLFFAMGQGYESTRETARALEAYRLAAEASRDWSAPWTALARLQSAADPGEAVATLRRGLTLDPSDPALTTALAQTLFRIQLARAAGKRSWAEFDKALADARAAAPGAPELALLEADHYVVNGKPEDAIALLETAAGLNPRASEVWLALVNNLAARGRFGLAFEALDRAAKAAGPQAGFAITRASLLAAKGQVREAKQALLDGLNQIPTEQKPLVWKTLGEFYQAKGDFDSARGSFEAWAKLNPENPEPRLALVEVAFAAGDEAAVGKAIESLRGVGGPKSYYWRFARVEDLIRTRPKEAPDADRDGKRLREAEALVKEMEANDPRLALGYLLEAKVAEKRKNVGQAVAAYRAALKRNAGPLALNPLVALLVKEGRDDDLKDLRETAEALPNQVDRLAALQAFRAGDKGRAEQLAALAVQGDPQGLDARVWQMEVLKALGKTDEAEANARRLTEERPSEPAPWVELLILQVGRRKTKEAAETVERIKSHVKTDRPELFWANCYRAVGDVGQAAACYGDAIRRWPKEPNVLARAVTFYEQVGRRGDAEAVLRAMLKDDPGNRWARRQLALSLASHAGNRPASDEALALVGADRQPDDLPDDLLTRAAVYAKRSDAPGRAKAIEILGGIAAEIPDLAVVQEQLARLLFQAGDLPGARAHAAKAAAGDRASPEAILFYAGVLLAARDFDAAEGQADRLASYDPEGLPVVEVRARLLSARDKGGEAAKLLVDAFEARAGTPEGPKVGEKMVGLLAALRQPDAAERVARRVAETGPRGRLVLAEWLAGRGKTDEAVEEVNRAAKAGDAAGAGGLALGLATRPKADPRWLGLADTFMAEAAGGAEPTTDQLQKVALLRHFQRRYADEVAAYEAILARNPDGFEFLNNMAWTLSEDLKKPDAALPRIEEAVVKVGPLPHVLDTRGVILARLGRLDDAARDLEAAAKALSTPSAYYHLARVYRKMQRPDDARRCRDRARELGLDRDQLEPSEQADWDAVMVD